MNWERVSTGLNAGCVTLKLTRDDVEKFRILMSCIDKTFLQSMRPKAEQLYKELLII